MRNHSALLLISAIWMLCAVLSREILARAVEMSLSITTLANYIQLQFKATSTQKMWLDRIRIFSLTAAGIFLILEIYFMFFA